MRRQPVPVLAFSPKSSFWKKAEKIACIADSKISSLLRPPEGALEAPPYRKAQPARDGCPEAAGRPCSGMLRSTAHLFVRIHSGGRAGRSGPRCPSRRGPSPPGHQPALPVPSGGCFGEVALFCGCGCARSSGRTRLLVGVEGAEADHPRLCTLYTCSLLVRFRGPSDSENLL